MAPHVDHSIGHGWKRFVTKSATAALLGEAAILLGTIAIIVAATLG